MGFFNLLFGGDDEGGDTYGDEKKWREVRDKENQQRREQRAAKKQREMDAEKRRTEKGR